MLPFINCQHNSKNVVCDLTGKRCALYPLMGPTRGIGKAIYKDTHCQFQKPWPEGEGRKGVKK